MKPSITLTALLLIMATASHAQDPTYYKDIAPIILSNCAPCHQPGEAAPFSLLTYEDVAKRASFIKKVVNSHYMPPWRADGSYRHFANERGLNDAQIGLLSRIAGRSYLDGKGGQQTEDCAAELDPNQVISIALTHLVTPMTLPGGKTGETPLEVMLDVVDDVNRAAPQASSALDGGDYESIAGNLTSFLTDKQRGLEQFYEVVRLGTE